MKRHFIAAVVLLCTVAVVFGAPAKKTATPVRKAATPVRKTTTSAQKAKTPVRKTAAPVAKPATSAAKPAVPPAKKAAPPAAKPAAPVPKVKSAGYRPAGTVSFAELDIVANAVAGIPGKGSADPMLSSAVPAAIRGQAAAKLFGPMRRGSHGVAVCYVDPAIAAKVAAAKRPSESDLDRVKRWCVVYPTAMTKQSFMHRHPQATPDANGTIKVPPGGSTRRTFWAWFAPDGQWAVLAPSSALAAHAFLAAGNELKRPLGGDLAQIRMDADGMRAVFGSALCAGGALAVRMTPRGLELRGAARGISMVRPPLPPAAHALAGVPANAPLFGITTTPEDVQVAEDIFAMAGPEFGAFVRKSLQYVRGAGATGYYLNVPDAPAAAAPSARLAAIMPEAKGMPATANVMFCSPTTVMRLCLPKVAARLMPLESAKLHVALRLLRRARGDGLACMNWREGDEDKLLVRISRDELWGTANLWSSLFF